MTFSRFVVVTGLSGAGKSQAMKSFEDLGFYCLDNLPPALVPELVTLAERAHIDTIALSLDTRVHGAFGEASVALDALAEREIATEILFLDASDATLVRRYSETRRRHPRDDDERSLEAAIARERLDLEPFRDRATEVWDTSTFTHAMLKERIAERYAPSDDRRRLAINVVAFGFKYGVPSDADLVLDVRFFANPNYEPHLKALTGADPAVVVFMAALPDTEPFMERTLALIDFLVPRYRREGKTRLTIAIGCTGGRHRSVYVAGRIAEHLSGLPGVAVAYATRELSA